MKVQLFGKSPRGVSTLEVLIAFAIMTLTLTTVIMVVFGNQSISIDSQTSIEALSKAQAQLESARALSRQDFSLVGNAGPTTDNIYSKTLTVEPIDAFTKKVTSLVSWTTGGRNLFVKLVTILTDFASVAGSCSPTPQGDWKNPQHWDFVPSNIVPGNNSNGLGVADMKVYKQKLYMAANFPPNSDDTVFVFSLPSDPSQTPTYLGSVDNNAASSDGLNAIALGVKGTSLYAYVASAHDANFQTCTQGPSCSQLQVVNVTNSASPSIVYSYKLPGVLGNMSSTGQAIGKSIYYSNGYVYLGLSKTASGPEFHIIDVSNPLAPVEVGSYAVGRTIESIQVSGNYAYLATDDNTKELTILDLSDKAHPTAVGGFNAPLNDAVGNNSGLGNAVFVGGITAYLGRTYSLSNNDLEFYILNNSNPAATLPVVGSKDIGTSANTDSVLAIQVRNTLAFLMTGKQFQVWDISNPASPTPWSSDGTTNSFLSLSLLGGTGTSFNCATNYFYTAVASSQGQHKDVLSIIGPGGIAPTSVSLTMHDASHAVLASASVGQIVHASAIVAGSIGTPTGSVTFSYYNGGSCAGTATANGTVALSGGSADPSTAVSFGTVGTYSYKAHYNGSYMYTALDSSCVPLTISKANQTINVTAHAPGTATYNSSFSVAANSSAGLAVAITTTGGCSVSGSTVTMTSGSTDCVVHYNQAGNANYNAATEVTETAVAQKATTITTLTCPASVTYNGVAQTPCTAVVTGPGLSQSLSVSYTNNTNAGTAQGTASYAGTANYAQSSNVKNFTITKATPSIIWNNPAAITYGTALSATQLNATANAAGAFIYTPGLGTVLNAGSQTLSVHFTPSDTANYNTPSDKTVTIVVGMANASMSAAAFNVTTNATTTNVNALTQIYAKAVVSGPGTTPGGSVTFVLYQKLNCPSGNGQILINYGAINLVGGVAKTPNYPTTSAIKTLSYSVTYSGDSNYNAPVAACLNVTVN